jgi:hypothetical protein
MHSGSILSFFTYSIILSGALPSPPAPYPLADGNASSEQALDVVGHAERRLRVQREQGGLPPRLQVLLLLPDKRKMRLSKMKVITT